MALRASFILALLGCSARAHKAFRASATVAGQLAYLVDARQTLYGLRADPTAYESNPLYGTHPGPARLVFGHVVAQGSQLAAWYLIERLPGTDQTSEVVKDGLSATLPVVELAVVAHNGWALGWGTWRTW